MGLPLPRNDRLLQMQKSFILRFYPIFTPRYVRRVRPSESGGEGALCALVFLSHILPSISSHIPYFFFPRFIQNRTEISPFFFIQELLFAIIGPELVHFLRKEERMDCKKSKTTHYLIRAEWLWGGIFCFLLSIAAGIWEYRLLNMQKQEDINPYEGQLRIEVTYDNWHSGLVDSASCSLCEWWANDFLGKRADAKLA